MTRNMLKIPPRVVGIRDPMLGGGSGSTMVIVLPRSTPQSTVDKSAQRLHLTFYMGTLESQIR